MCSEREADGSTCEAGLIRAGSAANHTMPQLYASPDHVNEQCESGRQNTSGFFSNIDVFGHRPINLQAAGPPLRPLTRLGLAHTCFPWITTTEAAPFVAVFDEWAPRTLTVWRSDLIIRSTHACRVAAIAAPVPLLGRQNKTSCYRIAVPGLATPIWSRGARESQVYFRGTPT